MHAFITFPVTIYAPFHPIFHLKVFTLNFFSTKFVFITVTASLFSVASTKINNMRFWIFFKLISTFFGLKQSMIYWLLIRTKSQIVFFCIHKNVACLSSAKIENKGFFRCALTKIRSKNVKKKLSIENFCLESERPFFCIFDDSTF